MAGVDPTAEGPALRQAALWGMLAAKLWGGWGVTWDIQWHVLIGRDSPWIPPHLPALQPGLPHASEMAAGSALALAGGVLGGFTGRWLADALSAIRTSSDTQVLESDVQGSARLA
jgi:hypothetical protein